MNMPKISIVMPVYNTGEQLCKTLLSVLNQTESDYELLIVDDGSTDTITLETESTFERFDDRIHIIKTGRNNGSGESRNIGMREARGKYIIFLDADDLFMKDMLISYSETLDETKADICIGNFIMHDVVTGESSVIESYEIANITDRVFSLGELDMGGLNYWMPVPWNRMMTRQFIDSSGITFQNLSNCNDIYFGYATVLSTRKIVYCKDRSPHMIYRINNPKQISYRVDSRNMLKAHEALLEWAKRECGNYAIAQILQELRENIAPMLSRCSDEVINEETMNGVKRLFEEYG